MNIRDGQRNYRTTRRRTHGRHRPVFESDRASRYTIVRAVKSRFRTGSEMGVFAMTEAGFLSRDAEIGKGSTVSVT